MIVRSNGRFARFIVVASAAAWLGFATACTSLDATRVELARYAVSNALADDNVDQGKSLDYREAVRHLALAEEALEDGSWQEVTDHEAYMATTLSNVARVRGKRRTMGAFALDALDQARRDTRETQNQVQAAVRRARALEAEETERGLVLTLGGVLFEFDSAELKDEALLSVARLAGFLIAVDDREAIVEGYTDNVGTPEYNRELSGRRAEAVRAALIGNRVDEGRIAAKGQGPKYPVADNESEDGRAQNRRVEIVILDPGESAVMALRGR